MLDAIPVERRCEVEACRTGDNVERPMPADLASPIKQEDPGNEWATDVNARAKKMERRVSVRTALAMEELTRVYERIAKRYDLQHALITARADQRGRKLLVEHAVSQGDAVLDCGSGTGTTGIMSAKKVVRTAR